jgi:predicted lipoprotein with Yx(FWY)xxD motif
MSALRTRTGLVAGLAIAFAVVAAGCGASGAGGTQNPGGSTAAAGALLIGTASSGGVGPFLTGPNGLTLYTKDGDSATQSTCTGGCATAWPPLKTTAGQQVTGAAGVTGTFASLTRDDGSLQVTYNGLPLYGWTQDTHAGDMTGDGVNGFHVALASGAAGGSPAPSATAGQYGY